MDEEKYVLNCPACGQVEGFFAGADAGDEDEAPPDADMTIEQSVVQTPAGATVRVRCPRCGQWMRGDRVRPA